MEAFIRRVFISLVIKEGWSLNNIIIQSLLLLALTYKYF